MGVVDDLAPYVDGGTEPIEGPLDDLDGPIDAGAERARPGEQDRPGPARLRPGAEDRHGPAQRRERPHAVGHDARATQLAPGPVDHGPHHGEGPAGRRRSQPVGLGVGDDRAVRRRTAAPVPGHHARRAVHHAGRRGEPRPAERGDEQPWARRFEPSLGTLHGLGDDEVTGGEPGHEGTADPEHGDCPGPLRGRPTGGGGGPLRAGTRAHDPSPRRAGHRRLDAQGRQDEQAGAVLVGAGAMRRSVRARRVQDALRSHRPSAITGKTRR